MPAFVSAQYPVRQVVVVDDLPVCAFVRDGSELRFQFAETRGEGDLRVIGQVLPGKNEYAKFKKCLTHGLPTRVVQLRQIDARDRGTERRVLGLYGYRHGTNLSVKRD